MEFEENSQMILDDVMIRYEVVRIAAERKHPTYGVKDLLFDARLLYEFIKEGKGPNIKVEH